MTWVFDTRYRAGGYFRCYKRDSETTAAWKKRNEGRNYLNEANRYPTRKRNKLEAQL